MPSTRVVLPWSTWAMMAILRRSARVLVSAIMLLRTQKNAGQTAYRSSCELYLSKYTRSCRNRTRGVGLEVGDSNGRRPRAPHRAESGNARPQNGPYILVDA